MFSSVISECFQRQPAEEAYFLVLVFTLIKKPVWSVSNLSLWPACYWSRLHFKQVCFLFFITATTHCRIARGVGFFSKLHLDAIHFPGKPICILFIHCNGWNFFKSPCESLVQFLICFSTSVMLALVPRFYGEGHKRLLKFYLGFFHWCITLAILTTLQACPDLSLVPSGLDSRSLPARVLNARAGFFFWDQSKNGWKRFSVFAGPYLFAVSQIAARHWTKLRLCCPSW